MPRGIGRAEPTKQIGVSLPPSIIAYIDQVAQEEGGSRSWVIRRVLCRWYQEQQGIRKEGDDGGDDRERRIARSD